MATVAFVVEASPPMSGRSPSEVISPQISLFHQVLIYAKEGSSKLVDGRWNLGQIESKLGINLSTDETKQLMACTGQIVCQKPGRPAPWNRFDEPQEPITASAVSVLRPDLLVTAQHVFFKGKKAVVPFERCSFRSYLHKRTAIPLLVEKDQRRGYALNNEDFVVVRLKRALKDCNSLAINDSDSSLPVGEQILSVTAHQRGTLNKITRLEPLVAKGAIRTVFSGFYGGPPFYHADIDLDQGGSGGAVFALKDGRPVSDEEGRLVVRGMLVGHGLNAKSGKPYSEERNYTIVIGLEEEFRDLVEGKAHKPAPVLPASCPEGGPAKIDVISESAPLPRSDAPAPLLQKNACGPKTVGAEKSVCTELVGELQELAKEIKTLAASPRAKGPAKEIREFRLRNDTNCPICFTYNRCNDYGCWDEAVMASGRSTLFAGVGKRAPVIKNPKFCASGPASADMRPPTLAHVNSPATDAESPPLPPRKPEQTLTGAADAREQTVELEAVFLAAKEKAKREGVWTLKSEDIRGLTLQQIKELRGY
jgi:hypothetical protein